MIRAIAEASQASMANMRSLNEAIGLVQSQQRIQLDGFMRDMTKIIQETSFAYREFYSDFVRQLDSVLSVQSQFSRMFSDCLLDVLKIYQNDRFQELSGIYSRVSRDIGALSIHFPDIKIIDGEVWIDGRVIEQEDIDEVVELGFPNIDAALWKKWDELPRTLRALAHLVFYITLTFLPTIVQNNPDATQLDKQQVLEAFQEAIRNFSPNHYLSGAEQNENDLCQVIDQEVVKKDEEVAGEQPCPKSCEIK